MWQVGRSARLASAASLAVQALALALAQGWAQLAVALARSQALTASARLPGQLLPALIAAGLSPVPLSCLGSTWSTVPGRLGSCTKCQVRS